MQREVGEYKYGFSTECKSERIEAGISEKIIIDLSKKRDEPKFILDFRLKAFRKWQKMKEPHWANVTYPKIDYQKICYYSEPKGVKLEDPQMLETLKRLGISKEEQERIAIDVVFDSVSLGRVGDKLKNSGVVLCSMTDAVKKFPELIKKYLGSVVSYGDNFFAALNSAVFSDGSFVYVPKGVKCPVELSTYFRINDRKIGQFERTLIVAQEESYVSYLEGCSAPSYDNNQLHAAVVELVAMEGAQIKYSTIQNWYPGDRKGKGGVFNFVTKRGICKGKRAKISWVQVEVGSAITWKYPGCILQGDESIGEFYSVALTNGKMQADTGTKMIHIGKNTSSTIISKGICADSSKNSYRGYVKIEESATNARNYTQCDSMLVGKGAKAFTFPHIESKSKSANVEHEASICKMNREQIFYLQSRGLIKEDAISLIVNGFCKDIIKKMPLEFAVESQKLLAIKLENSIG